MSGDEKPTVLFSTYEGVEIRVNEDGTFLWRLSERHHDREASSVQGAEREIKRQLAADKIAKRKKPHEPCLAVVVTSVATETEPPSYDVVHAVFRGFSRVDGTIMAEREKKTIDGVMALFPLDCDADANQYVRLALEEWRAAHEFDRFKKKASLLREERAYGRSELRSLLKVLDMPFDKGATLELSEDEVVARLSGEPRPIEALKEKLRRKKKTDESRYSGDYERQEALNAEP